MSKHKTIKSALKAAKETGQPQQGPKLNLKSAKVVVNMRVDFDLVESIKAEAAKAGLPYQTYLNSLIRKSLDSSLEKRIEKLEKIILNKKAA
jgi:predicted DNA binding CopG/RHH family protein